MRFFYSIAKFYPYLCIGLSVAFFELGLYYRRKNHRAQFVFWGMIGFFILTTLMWFVFRGDLNSDQWIRWMQGDEV